MYFSYEVTTTQKCDMACFYCFEGDELQNTSKQLNEEDIIKNIYDLLNNKEFMKNYEGIKLNFWGGEPTLNIKLIINFFKEFKDSPIKFFFYTNGLNALNIQTIINESRIFNSNRLSFQISFDGISHDQERVDHSGKGTHDRILSNIRYLVKEFPDINFSLKGTLPIHELKHLEKHWMYWKEFFEEFPQFSWSPTLEYTNKYIINEQFLKDFEQQVLKIAKLEILYFQKHGRFVWNWFSVEEPNRCSAGMNISNISIDGNLSMCHGAIYSKNPEQFIYGNIKDKNISQKILETKYNFTELMNEDISDICKGCSATVCYQCPVVNYDNSLLEDGSRYHDPKTDLCELYKVFGTISRTVRKYFKG